MKKKKKKKTKRGEDEGEVDEEKQKRKMTKKIGEGRKRPFILSYTNINSFSVSLIDYTLVFGAKEHTYFQPTPSRQNIA